MKGPEWKSLATNKTYSSSQRAQGFEKIFYSSDLAMIEGEKQILDNVIAAKGLLQINDSNWPSSKEGLNHQFRASLNKMIPISYSKADFSTRYEETFGNSRYPSGLLIYAAGLNTLNEPVLLNHLGQYVDSVLDNTFSKKRYAIENNPHLAKIEENRPGLIKEWSKNSEINLQTSVSAKKSEETFNAEKWLTAKLVVDKHLGDTQLGYLKQYLTAALDQRESIFSNLRQEIKKILKDEEKAQLWKEIEKENESAKILKERLHALAPPTSKKAEKQKGEKAAKTSEQKELEEKKRDGEQKITNLRKQLKKVQSDADKDSALLLPLQLQQACLTFITSDGKPQTLIQRLEDIERILQKMKKINSSTHNIEGFTNDVNEQLESLEEEVEAEKEAGLKVVCTDDPIDLLFCGTDVSGSCQGIDGDPKLNKGLLSYLMDGKNRLVAIKEGSKIVARCMLRLLWDGNQPVIYRERFYPDNIAADHKAALNQMAKQVAKNVAVPLTCSEGKVSYGKDLHALGGPVPYEYSDGSGGLQKEGRYTIAGANRMDLT